MKKIPAILFLSCFLWTPYLWADQASDMRDRHVRTNILNGNKAYREGNYKEAEEFYTKALSEDPNSEVANFNLALTLMRVDDNTKETIQGTPADASDVKKTAEKRPRDIAKDKFEEIGNGSNQKLAQKSWYNLGNMLFSEQNYAKSIEMYKKALRIDPTDTKAKQNLRVAQLKLQEQQQNKQNQDQNQQNQQQQNQNQQQQDQQQDKNQNPPPSDNEKKDDKKDNDSGNQPQGGQKPEDKKQPDSQASSGGQNKPQEQGISQENAEKILNAMDKREAATRKKVEKNKDGDPTQAQRGIVGNPW